MASVIEPTTQQVLEFCSQEPVERVFLEDAARRGFGRFRALEEDGRLAALCHFGANVVPSGRGCAAFTRLAAEAEPRMIIGEERAVSDFWAAAQRSMRPPREDRPGQPVFVLDERPPPGNTGLRAATLHDVDRLLPACIAAHEEELGSDPLARDSEFFRRRTKEQIDAGRSWVWLEDGVIRFKAEASAWTPSAVQLQQVWVDPEARGRGDGKRGLADLCRLLLAPAPVVCLFVRRENVPAIRLYEAVGMRRVLTYRSVLF